jgi:hypothetical protein
VTLQRVTEVYKEVQRVILEATFLLWNLLEQYWVAVELMTILSCGTPASSRETRALG